MENEAETNQETRTESKSQFGVPQAIFAGMIVIAASIYISFGVPNQKSAIQGASDTTNPIAAPPGLVEVSADDDPVLGRADAPVTIIEFSDFQCPFCRRFWGETLPQIKKDYIDTGKAKLVYRDLPLTSIHPVAVAAAIAGECADDQGRFWEMHDKIFSEQDKKGQGTVQFEISDLKKWAADIGLATNEFNTCLDSDKYQDEVARDLNDGVAAGVQGTPTFFVNGQVIRGAQPFAAFQSAIESRD